jgi:hypothetical protein
MCHNSHVRCKIFHSTGLAGTNKGRKKMNLQQTIADLESKAAQYTEAANTLRTLLQNTGSADGSTQDGVSGQDAAPRRRGRKPKGDTEARTGKKGRRAISPETRAKIGAAMKARHEQKRQAASEGGQGDQEEAA